MTPNPLRFTGLLPKESLEPEEHVSVHPALRDTNRTGDEIRPLKLVGNPCYRVFAPNWHRLEKHLLTMTTTGQNPVPFHHHSACAINARHGHRTSGSPSMLKC